MRKRKDFPDERPTLTPAYLVSAGVPERLAQLIWIELSSMRADLREMQEQLRKAIEVYERLPRTLKKRAAKEHRKCQHCGREFVVERRAGKPQRYCTATCRNTAAQRRYLNKLKEEQKLARLMEPDHPDTKLDKRERAALQQVPDAVDLPELDDLETPDHDHDHDHDHDREEK